MTSSIDYIGPKLTIDFKSLKHNYEVLQQQLASESPEFMAVVKANAYGMGLIEFVGALVRIGVGSFAVATLWEAERVKEHYPQVSVLVLGAVPNALLGRAADVGCALTITSVDAWRELEAQAAIRDVHPPVHIKVNTGMNRLGFAPDQAAEIRDFLRSGHRRTRIVGVYTHLALCTAESDAEQVRLFDKFCDESGLSRVEGIKKHVSDSIAAIAYPNYRYDAVRIGSALLGVRSWRFPDLPTRLIATFGSIVTHINHLKVGDGVGYDYTFRAERPSRIATVQIGYADGVPRSLSNRGYVEICGARAPIVGIMCMDQTMVDVTDIPEAQVGCRATIFGVHPGAPSLEEVSEWASTNRNEIFARISERVQREWR